MNQELSKLYEERVPQVKPKNVIKEDEVVCEDINSFLNRLRSMVKKTNISSHNIREFMNQGENNRSPTHKTQISMTDSEVKETSNYTTNELSKNDYSSTNLSEEKDRKKVDFSKFGSSKTSSDLTATSSSDSKSKMDATQRLVK
jgi:type IV secretory pathway TrbL component